MTKINCWDYADALAMAIRLRKSGNCPADIDNLYGEIVRSMVNMATVLLTTQCPKYWAHKAELMSDDVQATMLMHALVALDKDVDTKTPKKLVNYTVKCVQNRLRNHVRDTTRRAMRVDMVTESQLGLDIYETGPVACNMMGERISNTVSNKVCTSDNYN